MELDFTRHYGSNITRDQFNFIRADLEGARKHTAPSQIDLYDILCAMHVYHDKWVYPNGSSRNVLKQSLKSDSNK